MRNKLNKIMKDYELSLTDIEGMTQVSKKYLSKIKNNSEHNLQIYTIEKIVGPLGLRVADFIEDENQCFIDYDLQKAEYLHYQRQTIQAINEDLKFTYKHIFDFEEIYNLDQMLSSLGYDLGFMANSQKNSLKIFSKNNHSPIQINAYIRVDEESIELIDLDIYLDSKRYIFHRQLQIDFFEKIEKYARLNHYEEIQCYPRKIYKRDTTSGKYDIYISTGNLVEYFKENEFQLLHEECYSKKLF